MKTILPAFLLLLGSIAHAAAPSPLLRYNWTAPEIAAACKDSLAQTEKRYDALAKVEKSSRTFANTPREFNAAYYDLLDQMGAPTFLKDVSTDSAVRQAGTDCSTLLDEFDVRLYSREDLFQAMSDYAALKEP